MKALQPIVNDPRNYLESMGRIDRSGLYNALQEQGETNLKTAARFLERRGAEVILLDCTELPLIFPSVRAQLPVYGCLDIYANAVIDQYYLYNRI